MSESRTASSLCASRESAPRSVQCKEWLSDERNGNTIAVIHDAILNRAPTPLSRLNPDAPAKLDDIVSKCLEKDRRLRYQRAADLRTDLARLKRDSADPSRARSVPRA